MSPACASALPTALIGPMPDVRVDAGVAVADKPRGWRAPAALSSAGFHEHDGRGGVVEPRRVVGGQRAVFAEHGLEPLQTFERSVGAHVLVGVADGRAFAGLDCDGTI